MLRWVEPPRELINIEVPKGRCFTTDSLFSPLLSFPDTIHNKLTVNYVAPPVNDQCPWQFIHTDNDYLNFRQACISHRSWNQQFPADVDFQALLIGVNQILQSAINGGIRGVELFNGAMLASCINQEHYFGGQLWR